MCPTLLIPEAAEKSYQECGALSHSVPPSSEYGTHKTVKAKFWPWLSAKNPLNLSFQVPSPLESGEQMSEWLPPPSTS